jgi:hypothetical protein
MKRIVRIGSEITSDGKLLNESLMQLSVWSEVELWGGMAYVRIEEEFD